MLFCATASTFPKAVLTVRKAGESPLEYIKMKMTDCLISAVVAGGSERRGPADRERRRSTSPRSRYEYTPQKDGRQRRCADDHGLERTPRTSRSSGSGTTSVTASLVGRGLDAAKPVASMRLGPSIPRFVASSTRVRTGALPAW